MKKLSKVFIITTLVCISSATAYSQDCNSYLQQATEYRDKGDYCQAKQYYQMYQSCNADADVSTEIAMCINRIKIQNPGTNCPDYVPTNGKNTIPASTTTRNSSVNTSSSSRAATSVGSGSKQSSSTPTTRFKLGIDAGIQLPMGDFGKEVNIGFGGELSGKYMVNKNIGVGVGVGYYTFGIKKEVLDDGADKGNASILPIIGNFSYYFGKNTFKPYVGADLGLYMARTSYSGEVDGEKASESSSVSGFGFAPVIGFEYALSKNLGLDVNAKYNYITNIDPKISQPNINIGIVYSF